MAITFEVHGRSVYVRGTGNTSHAERVHASNQLLTYLASGHRFPQNCFLRPGKASLRAERLVGVERELENHDLLGLEVLTDRQVMVLSPDRFVWWRPDWELLNWWRAEYVVRIIDGRRVELPIDLAGRIRPFLTARQVRCVAVWSQSYLEKYASECPGLLKEPGAYGVAWAVDTVEFICAMGDPKYPFMPRPWRPHDLRRVA